MLPIHDDGLFDSMGLGPQHPRSAETCGDQSKLNFQVPTLLCPDPNIGNDNGETSAFWRRTILTWTLIRDEYVKEPAKHDQKL